MKKIKLFLYNLIFTLPWWLKLILTVVSAALITFTFLFGIDHSVIAYISYLLSAYTLTVLIASTPIIVRKGKSIILQNRYSSKIINDSTLRIRLKLYLGLFINLSYAIFKLSTGVLYGSSWFVSVAVYYFILGLNRFIVLRGVRDSLSCNSNEQEITELKYCRITGTLLLLLDLAISIMASYMIYENETYYYPGMVIYVSAAYTFYRLVSATVNFIKLRKSHSPLIISANSLDLSAAIMAIYILQTAMIARFSKATDTVWILNTITGTAVFILVLGIAIHLIITSTVKLKNKKDNIKT